MSRTRLLGAVLAGGESRRFGSDKAAAVIAGKSLVERAAETLAGVFEHVVIVGSREAHAPEWTHVPDLRTGKGPLAGIEAALAHAGGLGLDGAFVLACDLPLVDAHAVEAVVDALGEGPAVAPARAPKQGIEPLFAVYHVDCLPALTETLDGGALAAHRFFESIGGTVIELSHEIFLNVNRPEDGRRATLALERDDG